MKTTVILFAFILFGCSTEKGSNCHCTGKFSNAQSYPNVYYIDNVEYDCETGKLINPKNNDVFIGCK